MSARWKVLGLLALLGCMGCGDDSGSNDPDESIDEMDDGERPEPEPETSGDGDGDGDRDSGGEDDRGDGAAGDGDSGEDDPSEDDAGIGDGDAGDGDSSGGDGDTGDGDASGSDDASCAVAPDCEALDREPCQSPDRWCGICKPGLRPYPGVIDGMCCPEDERFSSSGACAPCPIGTVPNDETLSCADCPIGTNAVACAGNGVCEAVGEGAACDCGARFAGATCEQCADDWTGAECSIPCPWTGLSVVACESADATFNCSTHTDGNYDSRQSLSCVDGTEPLCVPPGGTCTDPAGCVRDAWIGVDLGSARAVSRLRFLSDWWSKRPNNFEVWASDDPADVPDAGAMLIAAGVGAVQPYQCVTGEACTEEVPDACCPDGRDRPQDTRDVGTLYPLWDILDFPEQTHRYWYFLVRDTRDTDQLIMREVEFQRLVCPPD